MTTTYHTTTIDSMTDDYRYDTFKRGSDLGPYAMR
jgi:hypothetical protein